MSRNSNNSEDANDPAYEVGYGRPPKDSQFKPGKSGNPRGSKKKSKSVAAQVQTELSRKVVVTENGMRKSIPLQTVMLRTIAAKAAKGDLRSANFLFNLADRPENQTDSAIDAGAMDANDRAILDDFISKNQGDQESEATLTSSESAQDPDAPGEPPSSNPISTQKGNS